MSDPAAAPALDPDFVHPHAPASVEEALQLLGALHIEGYSFYLSVGRNDAQSWYASLSRSGGPGKPDCWDRWRVASSPALALRNLAGSFAADAEVPQ